MSNNVNGKLYLSFSKNTESYINAARFVYDLFWEDGEFRSNARLKNVYNHLLDRAVANTNLGRRLNV